MTSKACVLSTALLALAACSKPEGGRPHQVVVTSDAKPERVTEQKEIEALLEEVGLVFNKSYKTYESREKLNPCDAKLLERLEQAKTRTEALDEALSKDNSDGLFRDRALELSRRVTDARASLAAFVPDLAAFCEKDHATYARCLKAPNKISVGINEHTVNLPVLHPYINVEERKPVVFAASKEEVHVRNGEGSSAFDEIFKGLTQKNLLRMEACARMNPAHSDLGRYVQYTLSVASKDMSARCDDHRRALEDLRAEFGPEARFSNMDDESVFCGLHR